MPTLTMHLRSRNSKRFKNAWTVLGDEEKRSNYDKYGTPDKPAFRGEQSAPDPRWTSSAGGDVPFDLEDLFGSFRSGPGAQQQAWPIRGNDVRAEIDVPFLLAANGGKHELRCQRTPNGSVETLSITVQAGLDSGSVIRLAGQGEPGAAGGGPGDMLVTVNIQAHPWFRREGANVLLDVPISITECALGTKVDIPTLRDGTVTITAGTSSGLKLRLRDKGLRDQKTGKYGDMFAVVKIVAPQKVDEATKTLLEQLQTALPQDYRQTAWSAQN